MKRSRVAKRYAQAMFDIALENKALDTAAGDLTLVANEYDGNAKFQSLIDSPVVDASVKKAAIDDLFGAKLDALTLRFLTLLLHKGREGVIAQIVSEFREMHDAHNGIVRGEVYSVLPLSDAQLQALNEKLNSITGKTVVITQHLDETLLGGVVVKIGDQVYDTSVRNQLKKLRVSLVSA